MKIVWLAAALLALTPLTVWAQPPAANPSGLRVTVPQDNVDGSPLIDAAAVEFCLYAAGPPVGPTLVCREVPTPWLDPPLTGALVTAPMNLFGPLADGLYVWDARLFDLVRNPSARSVRGPAFPWNVPPSAPVNLEVVP